MATPSLLSVCLQRCESEADFTLTFRRLALAAESPGEQTALRELFAATSEIDGWLQDWQERLAYDPQTVAERLAGMRAVNPAFVPRNHRVEAALNAASESGDYSQFREFLSILQRPYYLTPAWLRIDPTFAPLRGNPKFEKLVANGAATT